MTAPDPTPSPPAVQLLPTNIAGGCTARCCGTQDTVLLHPHHGRQCSDHITLPPGKYRPDLADDMVDRGRADAAFAYLGAHLAREIRQRFEHPINRLAVAW